MIAIQMDTNDWRHDLNFMLNTIDEQLEKIDQRFKAIGRPFDEQLQQTIVKITTLRFVCV